MAVERDKAHPLRTDGVKIPVRNLYYLLSCAWDRLDEADLVDVGADDYRHIVDLFGRISASGMEQAIRRGLDRGYVEHSEVLAGVRGKIEFSPSLKSNLFAVGRAACTFEELSHDVVHNRILKATVLLLLACEDLDSGLRHRLSDVVARFRDVRTVPFASSLFRQVQLNRNNGFYAFLLEVCRLVMECAVVDERHNRTTFRDFVRDEKLMAGLFERFLFNFYEREQSTFAVRREVIKWRDAQGTAADLECLPQMRTDVALLSDVRRLIIDAKYYAQPLQTHFGKDTVRSGHPRTPQ